MGGTASCSALGGWPRNPGSGGWRWPLPEGLEAAAILKQSSIYTAPGGCRAALFSRGFGWKDETVFQKGLGEGGASFSTPGKRGS